MSAATFQGADTTTQGGWIEAGYGTLGHLLLVDTAGTIGPASSLPAGLSITPAGASTFDFDPGTVDPRGPEIPGGSARTACAWYGPGGVGGSFALQYRPGDTTPRRIRLYCSDWDHSDGRAQSITLTDPADSTQLDQQELSTFTAGTILSWDIAGDINFDITSTNSLNPIAQAVYIDPAPSTGPTEAQRRRKRWLPRRHR